MLIAIVLIPTGGKRSKEAAIEGGKASAPMYVGMKGLIRKDYLNGDEGGGGVYLWESREAADAWYNEDWWPMMEKRFGVRPTLTYYDHYLTVDNAAGEVRVDGKPISLAQDAAE
ncbi:MAG: monooxygenase [Alphaproteobacteria bacterium]|jgi:hypothetical protein|nr:monooxygenase [Alphaproteobacteria bacterium]MDP6814996.1 monooxygenase [Alphaproteobacteria bacterium]